MWYLQRKGESAVDNRRCLKLWTAVAIVLWFAGMVLVIPSECRALCGSSESAPFELNTLIDGPLVYGGVKDIFNDRNISGAVARILDPSTLEPLGPLYEYVSESDGYFSITVPEGLYVLEVTHPGYKRYESEPFTVGGGSGDLLKIIRLRTATVILVHGWLGTAGAWEDAGWSASHPGLDSCVVWTPEMPGNLGVGGTQSLEAQVVALEDYIGGLDVASVYLVGHSFGGLVCRKYAEKSDPRGVVKLFTLATPNHGSPLAGAPGAALTLAKGIWRTGLPWEWLTMPLDELWEELTSTFGAVVDLIPNSPAILGLNQSCSNPVLCYDWYGHLLPWPAEESLTSQETEYFAVTASRPGLNPLYLIPSRLLTGMLAGYSDGVVPVYSAPLWSDDDRVRNYWDRTIDGGSHHLDSDFWTDGIVQSTAVRDSVIEWMFRSARTPSHWDPPDHPIIPPWPVPDGRRNELMVGLPTIDGVVGEGETVVETIAVEPTDSLSIALSWYEGNMFLELDDALGARVDTASAQIDRESGAIVYGIADPEPGDWTLRIISQPSAPQQRFVISSLVASDTVVELEATPSFARPGDDVVIRATLATGTLPELGAAVHATASGPLGVPTQMELYDDGTHGDELPDDGIYTNGFTAVEAGLYSIHVAATTAASRANGRASVDRESYALVNSANLCDVGVTPASLEVLDDVAYVDVPCQISCELTNLGVVACDSIVVRFASGTPFNSFCESTVALGSGETTELMCSFVATSPDTQSVFVTTYLRGGQFDENAGNDGDWIEFVAEVGTANLTIDSVVLSNPNPAPGEPITADIMVSNNNTARSTGTFVDVYYDLDGWPVEGQRGDQHIYLQPLMPGESFTITTQSFSYAGADLYSLCFQVDPDGLCDESDESQADNSYCTPVDTPVESSFYAVSTEDGHVLVRWSFSSSPAVEAFNVYRGLSSEGPFARVNGEPISVTSETAFEDTSVWPGTEFWYELRGVDAAGSESTLAGPVSATTRGSLSFRLALASPNPTSERTTFVLDLAGDCLRARVAIYDVAGRVVRTVIDGPMDRGRHAAVWDLRNDSGNPVAAGIYFARAVAGEWTETRKMAVIR